MFVVFCLIGGRYLLPNVYPEIVTTMSIPASTNSPVPYVWYGMLQFMARHWSDAACHGQCPAVTGGVSINMFMVMSYGIRVFLLQHKTSYQG